MGRFEGTDVGERRETESVGLNGKVAKRDSPTTVPRVAKDARRFVRPKGKPFLRGSVQIKRECISLPETVRGPHQKDELCHSCVCRART